MNQSQTEPLLVLNEAISFLRPDKNNKKPSAQVNAVAAALRNDTWLPQAEHHSRNQPLYSMKVFRNRHNPPSLVPCYEGTLIPERVSKVS